MAEDIDGAGKDREVNGRDSRPTQTSSSQIEQKAVGLDPVYTDLKNPDFGEVAKVMGI